MIKLVIKTDVADKLTGETKVFPKTISNIADAATNENLNLFATAFIKLIDGTKNKVEKITTEEI
ncbi:MAG: hypothetical protein SOZ40_04795 [Ezakiella sp.]|nr:hypothetical protein [Ezakiella sp.]MDD7762219.1 hypothetical protein [Bacillota bacterium]MDY3947283.1 hypothetical protein [Ezakiella sp.]